MLNFDNVHIWLLTGTGASAVMSIVIQNNTMRTCGNTVYYLQTFACLHTSQEPQIVIPEHYIVTYFSPIPYPYLTFNFNVQ